MKLVLPQQIDLVKKLQLIKIILIKILDNLVKDTDLVKIYIIILQVSKLQHFFLEKSINLFQLSLYLKVLSSHFLGPRLKKIIFFYSFLSSVEASKKPFLLSFFFNSSNECSFNHILYFYSYLLECYFLLNYSKIILSFLK